MPKCPKCQKEVYFGKCVLQFLFSNKKNALMKQNALGTIKFYVTDFVEFFQQKSIHEC